MSTYLKKAIKSPETDERATQDIVERILKDVKQNGEKAYLRHYGSKFKNWNEKIILSKDEIAERGSVIPNRAKDDLKFAYEQVYGFAVKQKESMSEFETELYPGVTLGQRLDPMQLRRLLYSRRSICACCFCHHEYRNRKSRRCSLRCGGLSIPRRPYHKPRHSLCRFDMQPGCFYDDGRYSCHCYCSAGVWPLYR